MAKLPFMTGRYKWFLKVLSVCAEFKGEDPDAECRRPTSAKEYNITTDNPALLEKTGIGKSADKKVKIYTPVKTHFYNEKSSKLPFMAGCYEWFFKALPVCECKSEDPNAKHRKPTSTKGNGHLCCVYNWMYPEADPEDKDWKNKKTIEKETKVFNDPIHGHMKLHPLLVRIINTPEFQRLRNIKQLGGAYFVYPGASHNRFEHSIGVGYLAGQLATSLKINQPELDISDQDVLCVQIAGLCHDLGHGPFSHLYDGLFISETEPKTKWKHEKASVDMFEYLVENNGLRRVMKEEYGLNTEGENENDLEFIKEMINRTENEYKGRSKEKSFLYDIVSNKETGIDVDKFDYFARDCYHLGFQSNFDHKRFIMFARVCDVDGKKYICSRDKEAANLYDIFHTRHTIHRRACQHRVTKSVEIMIKDALLKANDEIKIEGSEGKLFSLSEAKGDMEAYVKLTDQVVEEISRSTSESLKDAREIIERIMTRKLYWCVGEAKLKQNQKKISEEEKESLKRKLTDEASNFKDNFEVKTITMDYGMENTDPISKTYFYKKTKPDRAFKIPKAKVSMLLPEYFSETILRVYWKNPEDGGKEKKKESFNQWCKENNYEVHEEDDEATAGTDQ